MSVSHFVEPCVVPCSSVSSPQIGLQNLLSAMEQAKEESRVMEMRDSVTVPPVPLKGIELSGVQKAQLRVTDIPNLISSSEFSWNVDSSENMNPSQKKHTPTERLQRSRERNRMHARKTRQRKKQAMQSLQQSLDNLKEEQIRLRQIINEKNTANILVGLFASPGTDQIVEDPEIEGLLRRPIEEIPDASKIPELPALILPGHYHSKKSKLNTPWSSSDCSADDVAHPQHMSLPDDGIDYQLLGKDRSKCTPDELDQIRRERNRMHAKRTRDRKRLMMEEMEKIIRKLEDENSLLHRHLKSLGGETTQIPSSLDLAVSTTSTSQAVSDGSATETHRNELVGQLNCLLVAAGAFELPANNRPAPSLSAVSTSAEISGESSGSEDDFPGPKRKKLGDGHFRQSIAI